jgi:hypothetical protein
LSSTFLSKINKLKKIFKRDNNKKKKNKIKKIIIIKKNVSCKVAPSGVSFEISSSQLMVDRTSLLGRGLAFAFLSLYRTMFTFHTVPQFVADRLCAGRTHIFRSYQAHPQAPLRTCSWASTAMKPWQSKLFVHKWRWCPSYSRDSTRR